ncbi:MAG: hypothetical protein AAF483_27145 [Planctomycetota bacterium]
MHDESTNTRDTVSVKCLMVAKRDANPSKSADWKEGKVYFCCGNCLGKFNKMDDKAKEKMAAAANHQLVASKQYVQKGCPFSGGKVNEAQFITIKGAKVSFCCGNCKAKAEKMDEKTQVAEFFGEKGFKKAKFEPAKKDS